MSLSRAFTTRKVKPDEPLPKRSNTTKGVILRHQISAPVALTHTTNMLSYNAPDIRPQKRRDTSASSATATSTKSDESSSSESPHSAGSSPPTSPDISSIDEKSPLAEPNHLSCYFAPPSHVVKQPEIPSVPAVPKRAPSHTKKSHEMLARQRSNSRLSNQSHKSSSTNGSVSLSRTPSSAGSQHRVSGRPSAAHFAQLSISSSSIYASPLPIQQHHEKRPEAMIFLPSKPVAAPISEPPAAATVHHPFGQELAKVTEIAEEYAAMENKHVYDEDAQEIERKGLCKFTAEDYLSELQGLIATFFVETKRPMAAVWI